MKTLKYLYTLKQWFPESATATCPSEVRARPWGPYRGSADVLMRNGLPRIGWPYSNRAKEYSPSERNV
ncbi:hypothetical protein EYF80_026269 [Liparis tanakae]|uniref:Uncharacterized protein n=1 Tax=Liparis tanakae TaxID=230148 RepID=A0A4Z2HCB9_9TELE|nr:hypothetical protein EYF80_026269 [Liparis tanakae]